MEAPSEGACLPRVWCSDSVLPCFVTCPGSTPHPCGNWAEHPCIETVICVKLCAKCSHTGLIPLTFRRAVHVRITGPRVPRLVQGHPARTWPSRSSRPRSA